MMLLEGPAPWQALEMESVFGAQLNETRATFLLQFSPPMCLLFLHQENLNPVVF